jgi:hypothetical protein
MTADPAPTFVEAQLSWLVAKCGVTQPRADRRLNGIENTLGALVKQWRGSEPTVPERELRMSDTTRDALPAWVERCERASGETRARIAIYASGAVMERSEPDGWIRLLAARS